MPNYNQTLQTNNSSLEEIIAQLNTMPDAGNGDENTSNEISTIYTGVEAPTASLGSDGDIYILRGTSE